MKTNLFTTFASFAMLVAIVFSGCTDNGTNETKKIAAATATQSAQVGNGTDLLPLNKPLSLPGAQASNVMNSHYVIVFDDSGSMDGQKIIDAKRAFHSFMSNISPTDTVAMVTLNHGSVEGLTASKKLLAELPANGGTPLGAALGAAYSIMKKQIDKNKGYGNYMIIAITDGESTDSVSPALTRIYKEKDADIIIKTIGFQISSNNPLNSRYTQYFSADSGADLNRVLSEIKAESENFDNSATFN